MINKLIQIIRPQKIIHIQAKIGVIKESNKLENKKIIITGGSKGIGYAIAKKCVSEGAQVIITGRDEASLKNVAEELNCKYLVFDVTDIEHIDDFISNAQNELGGLTSLVNNAGISLHEQTFFDVTSESWDRQFATNLKGPFFLTQSFINHLKKGRNTGDVLFISSETGDTVDFRPYGYTKATINSMVKGLANLFKQDGIRINAVAPGVTVSDMTGVASDGNLYAGDYGQGRVYLPEEIAEVASFLLSEASGCISGQIITCNNAQTVNPRWR